MADSFRNKPVTIQTVDHDQMACFDASNLGLHCLPMSHFEHANETPFLGQKISKQLYFSCKHNKLLIANNVLLANDIYMYSEKQLKDILIQFHL